MRYVDGKLVVYVVLHPDPAFTGYAAAVDFFAGRGSTSSLEDVARLVERGCRAEDPVVQAAAENTNRLEAERQAAKAPSAEAQAILETLPGWKGGRHRRGRR